MTAYTATTGNASNKVTATSDYDVVITVNDESIENGSSVTWTDGENTVVIVVSGSGVTANTYTVTVTKE